MTVAVCLLVFIFWDEVHKFSRYGYVGIFVASFLAGVTVVIPVPSVFLVFTMGAALNPILVGLIAGAGEAVGSMGVYLTGLSNSKALHALDKNVVDKFQAWIHSRGAISVFAMSAIFNPLFFPFTAIAGMMHFGWLKFFVLCLAGKAFKNIIVAGAGFYGLNALLNLFGFGG